MNERRVQHGGCSFVPPDGFTVQELPAGGASETSSCCNDGGGEAAGICVTLTSSPSLPEIPLISADPRDRRADLYPSSITLTLLAGQRGHPLAYLRNAEEVLERHFDHFEVQLCQEDRVGAQKAARSQSLFVSNLKLFRLTYAWITDTGLLTATMMVAEPGVDSGWETLRRFVDSIRLD
jgi:hypothetical protein